MKKILLLALMSFSILELFSQIEKGKIIISVDGNYMKSSSENGVLSNQTITQGKYLNLGPSIGFVLTERLVIGVGFDYIWNKEVRENIIQSTNSLTEEQLDLKSYVFSPTLYVGYYYQIVNKLYFSTNLKFNFGKNKSEYSSVKIATSNFQVITTTDPTLSDAQFATSGANGASSLDYFSAKVSPEVTYFISDKLGLCLGLGGIQYTTADWKNENSSWGVNFNPTYWRLGVRIKI